MRVQDIEDNDNQLEGEPSEEPEIKLHQEIKIKRTTNDPDVFVRVPTVVRHQESRSRDLTRYLTLEMARKILAVNLQTLWTMVLMIPMNILNIYTFATKSTCSTNPEFFQTYGKFFIISAAISSIVFFLIAERKLMKMSQHS